MGLAGAVSGLSLAPGALAIGRAVDPTTTPPLHWRERALIGFGTTLWLRAAHEDAGRVDRALDEAVRTLRHIEAQMSLFRTDSALVRLNRNGHLPDPDPDLLQVLHLARRVAERSQGAFDITVQPLWALWQRAHAEGRRPSPGELAAARARVDWRGVSATKAEVRLARPGMALTLNGVAQGHAAGRVREVLRRHGIAHALLDTGEWAPMGQSPQGGPWQLGLADPRHGAHVLATLQADGRALAVSSDAHLRFGTDPADDLEHHILDPRTGHSPRHLSTVAVLADSPALADALTKVMFMGTAEQALAQARAWRVGVIAVDKQGRMQRQGVPA
jgi:thiamine biosynthesis lipoprotein